MHLSPRMVRIANFVLGHKMTVGTNVVWVDDDEVLLVRSKHGERRWGFPGGVLGKHEDPVDGACRELREETRLSVRPADLELVGVHVQEHGRHLDCVFRVRDVAAEKSAPLQTDDTFEIDGVGWWPVGALPPLRHESVRDCDLYPGLLG